MRAAKFSFLLLAVLAHCLSLSAQGGQPNWYILDYMKVKPGMVDKYLECEKAWKAIHVERVKQGLVESWELYQVVYPAGANTEYDYVTVTNVKGGWSGVGKLNASWSTDYMKLVPKDKLPLVQATESYRELVKTEVHASQDAVFATGDKPFKYAVVNYFDVPDGRWDEYAAMETKLVKPVHQIDIDAGKRVGWILTSIAIPSAHDTYDAATVDFYGKWDDVGSSAEGAWKKAHPDMTEEYIIRQIEGARKQLKREVWVQLDSAY